MNASTGERLQALGHRYAPLGGESYGEAFHRAFMRYIKANRESLFDITMAVSSTHVTLDDGPEDIDPLLLKAVYDTNPSLNATRLFGLDDDALQGAINTAKGKYFEYLVVERLNSGEQVGPLLLQDGQSAVPAESFTQPGWDLQIVDSKGAVVDYLQLKATDSVGYVKAALERYPDFQILATHEVNDSHLVLDSGLSDQTLQEHVRGAVEAAEEASVTELFLDCFSPINSVGCYCDARGLSGCRRTAVNRLFQACSRKAWAANRCGQAGRRNGVCA